MKTKRGNAESFSSNCEENYLTREVIMVSRLDMYDFANAKDASMNLNII